MATKKTKTKKTWALPWYTHSTLSGERDGRSQMICTDALPRRVFGDKNQFNQPAIVCQTHVYTSTTQEQAEDIARLIVRAVNAFADERRCTMCGWRFVVVTEHDRDMDFFCPHCGQ
jgi:hypothetical protein